MSEKIAIHCPAKDLWDRVNKKSGNTTEWHDMVRRNGFGSNVCIEPTMGYHNRKWYEENGYKIITAQQYLGGKDVNKCDNKKCEYYDIGEDNHCEEWTNYDLCEYHGGGTTWPELEPKTTKENNMELNSSIRTVFVEEDNADYLLVEKMQRVFGGEIDENFTGAMTLRDNKKQYTDEIKRLDDIEAKRLKEEAKKK